MIESYFQMTGSLRRVRLGVETLEGRDLPSTLPILSYPAPQASPPQTVHVSFLASTNANSVLKIVHYEHIGEEIPQ